MYQKIFQFCLKGSSSWKTYSIAKTGFILCGCHIWTKQGPHSAVNGHTILLVKSRHYQQSRVPIGHCLWMWLHPHDADAPCKPGLWTQCSSGENCRSDSWNIWILAVITRGSFAWLHISSVVTATGALVNEAKDSTPHFSKNVPFCSTFCMSVKPGRYVLGPDCLSFPNCGNAQRTFNWSAYCAL